MMPLARKVPDVRKEQIYVYAMPLARKVPDVTKEQIYVYAISR